MFEDTLKSANQELQDVLNGVKPAALGYWSDLPSNILVFKLKPVYGRFYDMAIAMNEQNLHRLVIAYYMPISPLADQMLGLALGYTLEEIDNYISNMPYRPAKEINSVQRTILKMRATIQKLGTHYVHNIYDAYINNDPVVIGTAIKEGIDLEFVKSFKSFNDLIDMINKYIIDVDLF